ncbi:MAG: acetylxylan esterase [Chloroflexota bacterium]|nr:acetylxylan esterase [Chloroflexota bacterium]MXW28100.1 acetylxylan esterase [Chloroflexota bacterium]MYC47793.1 acetylxylan esterase [Chloroflexota bacterium]
MTGPAVGFEPYWDSVMGRLAETPAAPESFEIPLRETEFARLFGVRLTGVGPYRLFGYLSVPRGEGPFPTIYWTPPYGSVQEIIPQGTANEVRSRFVTFSLAHRGQRTADSPLAVMFPGLLTRGIESPERYLFRDVVADAVRGLQFLTGRPEVDPDRLVTVGNDLALQSVALTGLSGCLVCSPELFFDPLGRSARTRAYPLEEYNDYLRRFPGRRASVETTLANFDLMRFAPQVSAPALIVSGPASSDRDESALAPLIAAIAGPASSYQSADSNYLDGVAIDGWIADQLGSGPPILPRHWD